MSLLINYKFIAMGIIIKQLTAKNTIKIIKNIKETIETLRNQLKL